MDTSKRASKPENMDTFADRVWFCAGNHQLESQWHHFDGLSTRCPVDPERSDPLAPSNPSRAVGDAPHNFCWSSSAWRKPPGCDDWGYTMANWTNPWPHCWLMSHQYIQVISHSTNITECLRGSSFAELVTGHDEGLLLIQLFFCFFCLTRILRPAEAQSLAFTALKSEILMPLFFYISKENKITALETELHTYLSFSLSSSFSIQTHPWCSEIANRDMLKPKRIDVTRTRLLGNMRITPGATGAWQIPT